VIFSYFGRYGTVRDKATFIMLQGAAKKDPSTKISVSSKRRNIFVLNFERLSGRKCATDGTCYVQFAEMVRLLVFKALFSSERVLLSV